MPGAVPPDRREVPGWMLCTATNRYLRGLQPSAAGSLGSAVACVFALPEGCESLLSAVPLLVPGFMRNAGDELLICVALSLLVDSPWLLWKAASEIHNSPESASSLVLQVAPSQISRDVTTDDLLTSV